MTERLLYDFHGLVGAAVDTADPRAMAFFEAEYGYFRQPKEIPRARLEVSWRRSPALRNLPGYRFHSHKMLARWSYRIALDESSVGLLVEGNRWAIPMVHHMMVHPSLRYLASQESVLLLHGSSVVRGGRSLVITGSGGAGKTTTAALLLASADPSWQIHADDYVFLRGDGASFAYPTRSHLYQSLLGWVPALRDRLTSAERIRLRVLWWIRRLTGDRVKWPVRVAADRLWPGRPVSATAKVGAIVLLRRSPSGAPVARRLSAREVPIEDLARMNFQEARHFLRLLEKAGLTEGQRRQLEAWRQREADLLGRLAERVPWFTLEIPVGAPAQSDGAEAVVQALEGMLAGASTS